MSANDCPRDTDGFCLLSLTGLCPPNDDQTCRYEARGMDKDEAFERWRIREINKIIRDRTAKDEP